MEVTGNNTDRVMEGVEGRGGGGRERTNRRREGGEGIMIQPKLCDVR